MCENLGVALDVVTGEVSYRLTWRKICETNRAGAVSDAGQRAQFTGESAEYPDKLVRRSSKLSVSECTVATWLRLQCTHCAAEADLGPRGEDLSDERYRLICPELRAYQGSKKWMGCPHLGLVVRTAVRRNRRARRRTR
jgi:hypothetical protein